MSDKPIPFSGPMVLANNEGRKTNTRRLLKIKGHKSFSEFGPSDTAGYDWHFRDVEMRWHDLTHDQLLQRLNYQVGDRLWVREAWRARLYDQTVPPRNIDPCTRLHYEADGKPALTDDGTNWNRYRHARFMPRWASRTTLIVTDVRVERLQDISKGDAIAEGATCRPNCQGFNNSDDGWSMDWSQVGQFSKYATGGPGPLQERDVAFVSPIFAFGNFINQLHGGPSWNLKSTHLWDENPWVVATTYTVHQCNIDAMEVA